MLDSLPVEQGSIAILGEIPFQLSDDQKSIQLDSLPDQDSLEVCYRRISAAFYHSFYNRDIGQYEAGTFYPSTTSNPQILDQAALFDFGEVETFGAITRGVTFGNRQNVFVNSALNLQMEGQLSDELNISALITDQNIPYQPEGNTQQIRDFDNVYVKLYNDRFDLTAGDVVLQNPVSNGYFLKYYKNVQGLQTRYSYRLNDQWQASSQVSGSIAKGQFASAVIQTLEGVQGPYKLRGANGERFVIILPNSEKVYLDGQLLQRGFDRDYVIDYNLGEITFSNTVVITQFSRIRVDYEYTNQYYSRANIAAAQQLQSDRTDVYFNYYQGKDNPNNTLIFDLNESDLTQLAQVGDTRGVAGISGVDSTGFIEDAILYRKVDTTSAGNSSVYVQSNDPQVAVYRISFSEVGAGNGDYQPVASTANGKVYQWVGEGSGNYMPIQVIPTPNHKQMFVAGIRHKISGFESVFQELAISGLDQNLYSSLDDEDNTGWAWKGGILSEGRALDWLQNYTLSAGLNYEFDQENFSHIDRFRSVDYDRDWGYDAFADSIRFRQDAILEGKIGLRKDALNQLDYQLRFRNRTDVVDGTQHSLNVNKRIGSFQFTSNNLLINNDLESYSSRWWRGLQQLQWVGSIIRPGYRFSQDQHQRKDLEADSITNSQMHFTAHQFFVESGDSLKAHFRTDYILRSDQNPLAGELVDFTKSEEFRFGAALNQWDQHQIEVQLNFRQVTEQTGIEQTDRNLLGKLNWRGSMADRHINSHFQITTANVRELRREYVFVAVPTGEGTHTWRDENGDGVQDINEFYEAVNPDEKNFIKLFTPTDEYTNAYQTTYLYQLDMKLPQSWKESHGLLSMLSKLSMVVNLQYNYKTTTQALAKRMNPFHFELSDDQLIAAHNLNRYSLFYNRNVPGLALDLTYANQDRKSLLGQGYELKQKDQWELGARWGISKLVTLRGNGALGTLVNQSDFLASRNFNLKSHSLNGQVVWQPSQSFRLLTGYANRNKHNTLSEASETSQIHEYEVEMVWQRSSQGNLNATWSWLEITFEGKQNTYLGYELLEGLQPGTNQRWNVNWQQGLGKGMQLSLQYFGRKSQGSDAVHTGNVQVTAFF